EENVAAMTEASQQVKTVEITRAVRSTRLNGLAIAEGQFIGLVDDDLVASASEIQPLVMELLERIGADALEIVTVYRGKEVGSAEAAELVEAIRAAYPDLELELLEGGQDHYHYIISAE
ncbi:MAG: DAK2 domain-containing protein, partial [Chloroflexota bacterium]